MDFSPEEYNEILSIFKDECEEIIFKINNNIVNIEKNPQDQDLLDLLFRDMHSLKGAARMIGFNSIQDIAHKMEDIIGYAKEKKLIIDKNISDVLYKTTDFLQLLINKSAEQKKEYISKDTNKYKEQLNYIIQAPQTLSQKWTKSTKENKDEFASTNNINEINAIISEFVLIFYKIEPNTDSQHLDILLDLSDRLLAVFEKTEFYNAKEIIKNINFKILFATKGTNTLDENEITYIKGQVDSLIKELDVISNEFKINFVDFFAAQQTEAPMQNSDTKNYKNIISEKIDEVINSLKRLETQLEYIPDTQSKIKELAQYILDEEKIKIADKISKILENINNSQKLPEKEIINVIKQCVYTFEDDINKTVQEDTSLLLQRLTIIEQMLELDTMDNQDLVLSKNNSVENKKQEFQKTKEFFKTFENVSIKTLRIDTKKLDLLVSQVSELIVSKIKSKNHLKELEEIIITFEDIYSFNKKQEKIIELMDKKHLSKIENENLSGRLKQIQETISYTSKKYNDLTISLKGLYSKIKEDTQVLNQIVDELDRMIKNIRLLPFATIFHMFPRMVRDIAEEKNKEIELFISGSDTCTDKKIIEEIKSPLIHIVRNAIDHGIETPDERLALGKPRTGSIKISARQLEHKIIIEITDDGAGINIEKIRQKALQKGLLTQQEIDSLSNEQIMNLIFIPGFSTGDKVTEISGRGIGLDIVQSKIAQLDGKVNITSKIAIGSTVTIELPISMATVKSLIVEAGETLFALPISNIKSILQVTKEDIHEDKARKSIIFNKKIVPIFDFCTTLNIPNKQNNEINKYYVILLEFDNNVAGFIVDKLFGDQETLQKKLSAPIFKIKNISGVTTLASGKLCLIVNVSDLIKTALNAENTNKTSKIINKFIEEKKNTEYNILVVDDSHTTRTLISNILQKENYNVTACENVTKAMAKLSQYNYNLIISDIEMPDINGYEFLKYIKTNEMYYDIPVILVSSKPYNPNHLDPCGVAAYLKKSDFNQDIFLDKISEIIKKH